MLAFILREPGQRRVTASYDAAVHMIDDGEITAYHADGGTLVLEADDDRSPCQVAPTMS